MKPMLILTIYILACIQLGYIATSFISNVLGGYRFRSPQSDHTVISLKFAFGSTLLSSLWLLLALGGLLRNGIVWAVLLVLFAMSVRTIYLSRTVISKFSFRPAQQAFHKNIVFSLLMLLTSAIGIWLGILSYVRPPFGDADAFYMVYPKIIAATGKLAAMPGGYHDFSTIGLSGELHFATLMLLSVPAMAKLFAWVTGIGITLLLRDIIRLVGGGLVAQGVAVVVLITSTTFSDYLSDGKTDLFVALIGLAAIYSLLLAREQPVAKTHIAIAGLLTGFSLTAKFSFIVALLPAVVLLLVLQEITRQPRLTISAQYKQLMKTLGVLFLGILLASLPHLLKNHWLFGHALAPFIGMNSNWADQSMWFSLEDTLWIVATYPFALVYGLYPLMGGNISFLWLAAIPMILYLPRRKLSLQNPLIQITLSACFGLLCWLAVKASVFAPRYILTTLILLIPLPAIAVEQVWLHETRPRLLSLGFAAMAAVALITVPFTTPAGVWTAVPGKIINHIKNGSPDCGLAISSYCSGLNAVNEKAQEGDRVFMAGYYTYFLRPDLLQCINETVDFKILNQPSTEAIWTSLYNNGYTFVAVQKATHGQYLSKLNVNDAPPWLKVSTEFVDSDMPVFHLQSIDSQRQPEIVCAHKGRKAWAPMARERES